ncbi:MAG: hypothetical protein ABI775_01600 [Pseudonocardiales bacterium]|nr:hypothetical protein [Actinomycetota bacterium]
MSETPGAHLEEEPQEERGAPGTRDTGSDEPAGGPADRPAGTSDEDSDSSVDAQGANHPDAPDLPSGDGGG